ncbi:MAG: hypothetical protein JXR34_12615 [Bacteroidales bacterium]|nr:hypothetical protein [Bacteroidales bacterium]
MTEIKNYMDSIRVSEVLQTRIENLIQLNQNLFEFEVLDIFISEYRDKDGNEVYTSLWLFTNKGAIECKNFIDQTDFDVTPITNNIEYCSILVNNFDFVTTNQKSFVKALCNFGNTGSPINGSFTATDANCKYAIEIYKRHFLANLRDYSKKEG